MMEEIIDEKESKKFVVKLALYKMFGTEVQFKTYLHGLSDADDCCLSLNQGCK